MIGGVSIGNGINRYWAQDALLGGFDYFNTYTRYFPAFWPQPGSLVVKIKRKSPTPRESFQSLARQSKGSKRLILSTS
jgi:hypothetical protein